MPGTDQFKMFLNYLKCLNYRLEFFSKINYNILSYHEL